MATLVSLKAFHLCDQVIKSEDGKYSIIGIWQKILSPVYPTYHARFSVYFKLVGMNGTYDIEVKFIDPEHPEITALGAKILGVQHTDKLIACEGSVNFKGMQINKTGTFEVHLLVNNERIHVDMFQALILKQQP